MKAPRWPQEAITPSHSTCFKKVVTKCTRNEAGILYAVFIVFADDIERCVWATYVHFGKSKACQTGGAHFVAASRRQDEVVTKVWEGRPL